MNDKSKILTGIFIFIWTWNFLYFEELVFMNAITSLPEVYDKKATNFVIIADPQLTDFNSYSFSPKDSLALKVIEFYSDLYMKKSFHYLSLKYAKKTNSVIFLGDMMDSSRSQTDEEFTIEMNRFNQIFKTLLQKYFIAGNHDIGLDHIEDHVKQRYVKSFSPLNYAVEIGGYLHIFINSIQLDNLPDPKIWEFLDSVSKKKNQKRILYTHIPLWRHDNLECNKFRSRPFMNGRGRDYQNMLSAHTSKRLLDLIKPIRIFSGDDHEPCEFKHGETIENIVPTFSWLQGSTRPGFGILTTLEDQNRVLYTDIFTPRQTLIFIWYAILFALTLITLMPFSIYFANQTASRGKNKKYDTVVEEIEHVEATTWVLIKQSISPLLWVIGIEFFLYLILLIRWI